MKQIRIVGNLLPHDGYGALALALIRALEAEGLGVTVQNMSPSGELVLPVPGIDVWHGEAGVPTVIVSWPLWWPHVRGGLRYGFTMFETSRAPADMVALINAEPVTVITPSDWGRSVFSESGVSRPVVVAPLGVDTDRFPLLDRTEDRPLTFLWEGDPGPRKGWDIAYRAFIAAFGSRNTDVHLHLRFRHRLAGLTGFADPNVSASVGPLSAAAYLEMLRQADVFVFPSRGEGWGLPAREAAATGQLALVTRYGGLAVEADEWAWPTNVCRLEPASFSVWEKGEIGEWAVPDFDHLVDQLRWCAGHRDEVVTRGRAAAAWLRENGTWARTAQALRGIVGADLARHGL